MITDLITKYTGFSVSELENKDADFTSCLENQKITLYINAENIEKSLSSIQLINYLQYFKIKNCLRDNSECLKKGISYSPSWAINNNIIAGDIGFKELTEFSGCRL